MNRIRTFLAAAAVAFVGAATIAASEAQAQTAPVIEYSTRGGFVLWNYDFKIYGTGFVVGRMVDVRNGNETLYLYDYISQSKLTALKNALDRANFSRLPATVKTQYMIMDVPDRVIKYRGKTVRYTTTGGPRDPVASVSFVNALTQVSGVFTKMADEPLVIYDLTGGWGISQDLRISRSGRAKFDASFRGQTEPTVERQISFAKVNELKRRIIAANWWNLPAAFPGPIVMDGASWDVTVYDIYDTKTTVHSKTMATEPQGFERVMEQIYEIVHDLTT